MERPCQCDIEPPGSISHGVSSLFYLNTGLELEPWISCVTAIYVYALQQLIATLSRGLRSIAKGCGAGWVAKGEEFPATACDLCQPSIVRYLGSC